MAANTVTFRLLRDEEVYEDFEVEKVVAMESEVVKNFIEKDTGMEPLRFPIPCRNIKSGKVLEMVLDYCKFHAHALYQNNEFAEKALSADKNQVTFCHILLAANFLEIEDLFCLLLKAGADLLKDKSVEELRQIFKIENDFSEQEEEAIMQETKWTYA
ncbi:SKP1-like protein 14 [Cryptomeria japonica]|nr:SKP1-like protein 14 [Cryptomeria japonica]XP_059071978.1 SKP1-like protein 14 [Cryptomeria japonica]